MGVHHCGYACSKNNKLSVTVRDCTGDATSMTLMAMSDVDIPAQLVMAFC